MDIAGRERKGRVEEPKTISTLVTAASASQRIRQTLTVLKNAPRLRSKKCLIINDGGEQTGCNNFYHLFS